MFWELILTFVEVIGEKLVFVVIPLVVISMLSLFLKRQKLEKSNPKSNSKRKHIRKIFLTHQEYIYLMYWSRGFDKGICLHDHEYFFKIF